MTTKEIGTAYETDIALPLRSPQTRVIGPAIERDEALPITAVGGAALSALIMNLPRPDIYEITDDGLTATALEPGDAPPDPVFEVTAAGLEFATLIVAIYFCLERLRSVAPAKTQFT